MSSLALIQAGSTVMVAVHTDVVEVFFRHVVPVQSKKPYPLERLKVLTLVSPSPLSCP